jgi:hypothetical protein
MDTLPRAMRPGHSQLIGLASISDMRFATNTGDPLAGPSESTLAPFFVDR